MSNETKGKVVEIDASLERNVVELLCNTLLNLPVSIEDIKDALQKVLLFEKFHTSHLYVDPYCKVINLLID